MLFDFFKKNCNYLIIKITGDTQVMTDLQTTIEFSVELYKFYNVDLFQRGYYQIRTSLRISPRFCSKLEVCLPNTGEERNITSSQIVFPSCVVNGSSVSKTFQILYRNEEVVLEDVAVFRIHLIVDSRKIEDSVQKADFQLVVELWFTEQTFGPEQHNSIQCVSSRTMRLHLCPLKGLHHHLPVLFDYFHLSAVTLTVHGCLLAIHQPYMNVSRPGKPAWLTNSPKVGNRFQPSTSLESVLFGNMQGMRPSPSLTRLNQAHSIHQNICTLLLSSYESLQNKLIEYMKLLPPWQQLKIEVTDCYSKLRKLKETTKYMDAEDELLAVVNSDIAQLCAENIILWQQFLEAFTLKDRIQQHLTREHHLQRVKRFAEGFFVIENPRQFIFRSAEQSYQVYLSISDNIRKTKYFSSLPALSVECPEMDGNAETLPIIFEDHYQDPSWNKNGGSKRVPSAISVHDIGFDVLIQDDEMNQHKQLVSDSNGEYWQQDNKQHKLQVREAKPPKTVGCFSTGILPKTSVSSEDLYYVGSNGGSDTGRQSGKWKIASLPRGCASVEESVTNDDDDGRCINKPPAGPKTSASAEQISRLREELTRCGFSSRYFRTSSSAAVPKFVKAKRREAFRASGSRSLSAVEESAKTSSLNGNCPRRSIPRLETVPLFPQSYEKEGRLVRPLVTSSSMDLDMSKKSCLNGTPDSPQTFLPFEDGQRIDVCLPQKIIQRNKETKCSPAPLDNKKVNSASSRSASSGLRTNVSSSSCTSNRECSREPAKSFKGGIQADQCTMLGLHGTNSKNVINSPNPLNHPGNNKGRSREASSSGSSELRNVGYNNSAKQASSLHAMADANSMKKTLKESLKLELKPVNEVCHQRSAQLASRRAGTKTKKKFSGLQLMHSLRYHSPGCSTSSDSVVLTGYKKLEQSESLPVGLALVGQHKKSSGKSVGQTVHRSGRGHIVEEDENTDDDLSIQLEFTQPRLRKSKVTRSMPNMSVVVTKKNADMSMVTSESMPDLGSEATDDPSSVGVRMVPNHRFEVTRWSSSDSARVAPKATVEEASDLDDDDDVAETPKNKCQPPKNNSVAKASTTTHNSSNKTPRGTHFDRDAFTQKKKRKKKRKMLPNRTTLTVSSKKQNAIWYHLHRGSHSSSSSSSSTSERSGWVSSECSSLDSSTSDNTRGSSPIPSLSDEPGTGVNNNDRTECPKTVRVGQEVVEDSGVMSSTEEERHIYEEIHLPPEEFRDPSPASSILNVIPYPPSPFANTDRRHPEQCPPKSRSSNTKEKDCGGDSKELVHDKVSQTELLNSRRSHHHPPQLTRSKAVHQQPTRHHHRRSSKRDVEKNANARGRHKQPVTAAYLDTKCTILEMFSDTTFCGYAGDGKSVPLTSETSNGHANGKLEFQDNLDIPEAPPPPRNRTPSCPVINTLADMSSSTTTTTTTEEDSRLDDLSSSTTLVSLVGHNTVNFVKAKEDFKKQLNLPAFLYSDCPLLASTIPYFHVSEDYRLTCNEGLHLVICVHGLDGNSADLRLVKTYLELGLPCSNLEFLMSERNQGDTFSDFEKMTDKLVAEILYHIEVYRIDPIKISFIGHSLGNIIIRSALARPQMKPWLGRLHTFLSLSGPHLGTLYNSSGLVNMGLWFMQKWKKSGSLLQLSMKDASDIRRTFLYKLSQKPGLEHFKNILLFGSSQDRYVPIHSARIELCKSALKDTSVQGMAYRDMVHGLLQPVARNPNITFVRYDVHHALPNTANSLIGRAAHIAVLDSELFIEKFLTVCGLKYFK